MLAVLPACDSSTPAESEFFDPEALDENSVVVGDDFDAVECAGEGDIELRGQVLAPAGRLAFFPDWLVPSAHAAPLEGELVVSDVEIELYDHRNPDEIWASTRSDAVGRYCLVLPAGREPSTSTILRARAGEASLRRVVTHRQATTISISSEAVTRIILDSNLNRQQSINLETMADTALDLLEPTAFEGENVETAVSRVQKVMLADHRVRKAIASSDGARDQ